LHRRCSFRDAAEFAGTVRAIYPNDARGQAEAVDRLAKAHSALERSGTFLPPALHRDEQVVRSAYLTEYNRVSASRNTPLRADNDAAERHLKILYDAFRVRAGKWKTRWWSEMTGDEAKSALPVAEHGDEPTG
jgi:hypothetical protein